MNPPFFGSKIIEDIKVDEVFNLIDRKALFYGRWQLNQEADPILERLKIKCVSESILELKIVYGYFKCRRDGNLLFVDGDRCFKFDFPRERTSPNRCVADFFSDGFIPIQLVTVGSRVAEIGAKLFKQNSYVDAFYLKGLAAESAEALAKYCHNLIRKDLGVDENQGERFSPGYPVFPDLFDQRKIMSLLKGNRIGVKLTETCELVPEYSTSAIISVDPKATYFRP